MVTRSLSEPRKGFYILAWFATFVIAVALETVIHYVISYYPISMADFIARQGGTGDYPGVLGSFWILFLIPFSLLLFNLHKMLARGEKVRIWTLYLPSAITILVLFISLAVFIGKTCGGEECMGIAFVPPYGAVILLVVLALAIALHFVSNKPWGQNMLHSWFNRVERRVTILCAVFAVLGILFLLILLIDHPSCGRRIGIITSTPQIKCLTAEAIAKGNPGVCGAAQSRDSRSFCYARLAELLNDSTLCSKVEDGYTGSECFYDVAVRTKDPSLCSHVSSDPFQYYSRDVCYTMLAELRNDSTLCSNVQDTSKSNSCFYHMALRMKDPSLCTRVAPADPNYSRDFCYGGVALLTHNTALCSKITESWRQEACIQHIQDELRS